MELDEFILFVNELNIKSLGLTIEQFFKKIDTDNSGKIDFNEFVKYYKELTSGGEFLSIFEEYSQNKISLSVFEFYKFMTEMQKAKDFFMLDALSLFYDFCSSTPKDVKEKISKKLEERDLLSRFDKEYVYIVSNS